jgi:hypothetical protein
MGALVPRCTGVLIRIVIRLLIVLFKIIIKTLIRIGGLVHGCNGAPVH